MMAGNKQLNFNVKNKPQNNWLRIACSNYIQNNGRKLMSYQGVSSILLNNILSD